MPKASNVSSSNAFSTGKGRRNRTASKLSSMTLTADSFSPARSRSSRNGTPVHSATPAAPSRHGVPSGCRPRTSSKKTRPLPAHSSARTTETWGMWDKSS
jgi:hypothetical protein